MLICKNIYDIIFIYMDYREAQLLVLRRINMEEMKDIIFLDSEIIEDDDDAPVGTLIRLLDDGTVEEINSGNSSDKQDALRGEQKPAEETVISENEQEIAETQDEQDLTIEPAEEISDTDSFVATAAANEIAENSDNDSSLNAPTQMPVNEAENATDGNDVRPDGTDLAYIEQNVAASDVASPSDNVSDPHPNPTATDNKPKSPRKPKAKTENEKTPSSSIQKTGITISNGETLNDELHNTDFKIDKPSKPVSVVSTKKKKEKVEDLWAVAPVAQKKTSAVKETEETKQVETKAAQPSDSKSNAKQQKQPVKPTKSAKTAEEGKASDVKEAKTAPEKPVAQKKSTAKSSDKQDQKKVANKQSNEDAKPKASVKSKAVNENKNSVSAASTTSKIENKNTKAEAKMAKDTKVEKTEQAKKPAAKQTATKPETTEKVLIAGDDSIPHGKFVIKLTEKGNYVYKLYSYNYRVVAIGAEQYSALPSCKGGIQSVIKNAANAPVEDLTLKNPVEQKCPKWVIYKDKKEEFRLRLIASNGNIVATTNDGYLSKDAAKKGIEAIARAAKGASVVRNDDLW